MIFLDHPVNIHFLLFLYVSEERFHYKLDSLIGRCPAEVFLLSRVISARRLAKKRQDMNHVSAPKVIEPGT